MLQLSTLQTFTSSLSSPPNVELLLSANFANNLILQTRISILPITNHIPLATLSLGVYCPNLSTYLLHASFTQLDSPSENPLLPLSNWTTLERNPTKQDFSPLLLLQTTFKLDYLLTFQTAYFQLLDHLSTLNTKQGTPYPFKRIS